jgi:hypothetical protein
MQNSYEEEIIKKNLLYKELLHQDVKKTHKYFSF